MPVLCGVAPHPRSLESSRKELSGSAFARVQFMQRPPSILAASSRSLRVAVLCERVPRPRGILKQVAGINILRVLAAGTTIRGY